METKELVLICAHGMKGMIDVKETDTLADVRKLIMEELDDDLIVDNFAIHVNDCRISAKQEKKKLAWSIIDKEVSLQSIVEKRKRVMMEDEVSTHEHTVKKARVEQDDISKSTHSQVTPMSSTRNDATDVGENVNNVSMEQDDLDATNSPMKTKSLDPVFEKAESLVPSALSTEQDGEAAKLQNSSTKTAEVVDEAENNSSSLTGISKEASNVETLNDNQDIDFGNNDIHDDDDSSEGSIVDCLDLEIEEGSSPVADSSKKPEPRKPDAISIVENNLTSTSRKKSSQEEVATPTDECRETVEKSREILDSMKTILEDNEIFCSNDRRQEWLKEISGQLNDSEPKTTIGVLGNTGVGKSSLLNALLDEASVLPTSGSRGCTAAVVELRFNADMEKADPNGKQVACYRGDVEFMTLQEWQTELKILVDECSTHDKTVYAREPDPQTATEAAAAWAKIDQVYGKGTMSRFVRQQSTRVFFRLANDFRVRGLLTAQPNSGKQYNVISVSEGLVVPGSNEAKGYLANHQDMNRKARRTRNKWAKDFRAKINSYVYRKGNGEQAQTWPLIRKVVLHGPWACLSTGACLVDLPGVRDANAVRAKVAEQYLQNCSQIWVVAPIKRAVDDGTAKELLGEQFKRRLLMDGSYGNVSFICTQTDDCEATEIMRDHYDVAQSVPGRWEEMNELLDKINSYELKMNKLQNEEEILKEKWEDANEYVEERNEELIELQDECEDDSDEVAQAEKDLKKAREHSDKMLNDLSTWKENNIAEREQTQSLCAVEQRKLKTLCALVRNEYSTKQLQLDFLAGLKELYRKSDDESENDGQDRTVTALPDDFNMDVHCISSNDYLKIQGIKPKSDGPPTTFSEAEDTNIPELRTFVHGITKNHRFSFAKSFVNNTSDLLDRMKLLAVGAAQVPSGRSSIQCMRLFQKEVEQISEKIDPLAKDFANKLKDKVKKNLEPALANGAQKGINAAMPVVNSWGSKSRRTRHHRSPENNGLYWATYQATVRRGGVFTSGSAGPIDMNQELCDPMEKEFSVDWQRGMQRKRFQIYAKLSTK